MEPEDVSDEDEVPESARSTPAYQELLWLKRIRREKELEQRFGPVVHQVKWSCQKCQDKSLICRFQGFRCDGCDVEPIVGGRFQCSESACKGADTVDFCCECAPKGLEVGGHHFKGHVLRPVRKKEVKSLVDEGYGASKNYLDPNFMN